MQRQIEEGKQPPASPTPGGKDDPVATRRDYNKWLVTQVR